MKYDILPRLIEFNHTSIEFLHKVGLQRNRDIIGDQLSRAALSSVLNYSEALASESRKDFIHKMSISLKELREARSCLLIIERSLAPDYLKRDLTWLLSENDQLIAIFVKSINTAKSNLNKNN